METIEAFVAEQASNAFKLLGKAAMDILDVDNQTTPLHLVEHCGKILGEGAKSIADAAQENPLAAAAVGGAIMAAAPGIVPAPVMAAAGFAGRGLAMSLGNMVSRTFLAALPGFNETLPL